MRPRFLPSADQPLRSGYAIALFVVVAVALFWAAHFLPAPLLPGELARAGDGVLSSVVSPGSLFAATWLCCRVVPEPMALAGFPARAAGRLLLYGFLIGAAFITVACVVPALAGASTLAVSALPPSVLVRAGLPRLVTFAAISASEELVLRGFLFRQLSRGTNPLTALLVTALLFGVSHFRNPHSSWAAAAVITLAGLWLGLARLRTGSIWAPIGMHAGWNCFEGLVWGQPVSGQEIEVSLVRRTSALDHGEWTGGAFGPEAAWLTAGMLLVAISITLLMKPSIALLRRSGGSA